jgi:hypothetical protein
VRYVARVPAAVCRDRDLFRLVPRGLDADHVREGGKEVVVVKRHGRHDWVWPLLITLEIVGFLFLSWLKEQ